MTRRKVWPIYVRISLALTIVTMAMGITAVWIDSEKLGVTALITLPAVIVSWIIAGTTAEDGDTYEVKPRGWRKIRRQKEREAYIHNLERELGIK